MLSHIVDEVLSSFFGGHEPEYATPRDQYVYFADFEITVDF
jgi:hypothetical protein